MQKFWIQTCTIVACVSLIFVYNSTVNERTEAENIEKESYNKAMAEIESEKNAESNYKDGIYNGEAKGFGGTVAVEVTVENGKINKIDVTSHEKEDAAYFDSAIYVIDEMIDEQSTDVDTVSGATFSSNGIIGAVKDALGKAENKWL